MMGGHRTGRWIKEVARAAQSLEEFATLVRSRPLPGAIVWPSKT